MLNQEHRDYLAKCNCMIKHGDSWTPARRDGMRFFAPNGLRILTPSVWKDMPLQQIYQRMDDQNMIPIYNLGDAV